MRKYTIETLTEINRRFTNAHYRIEQSDVNMVNDFIELIEKSCSVTTPKPGDVVEYTNEYGEYFPHAHIETVENGTIYLCECANTYISKFKEDEISCSSSGGTWKYIEIDKLKYVGAAERRFWHFGHCGACADGGIDFYATVNVWKYNLNKEPFSTKTHDKYYLSYSERRDSNYHYFASKNGISSNAWETEKSFQAWLRTYRAIINGNIAWTYKEEKHHVSPEEYEKIDGVEDVIRMNGLRLCKRVYDDVNFTVHTYFVWYWDDPTMGNIMERTTKQNEIIKRYELICGTVNSHAINELNLGKIKPIDVKFD